MAPVRPQGAGTFDIVVKLPSSLIRTDGDIARAAASGISWFTSIPANAVSIVVRDGWITLAGELEYGFQKTDAQVNVQYLAGVKGVTNLITIKSSLKATDVKGLIETAFARSALVDADQIQVEASGHTVTLRGKVRNLAEHDEAERVAWSAPGVWSVANNLDVKWSWGFED